MVVYTRNAQRNGRRTLLNIGAGIGIAVASLAALPGAVAVTASSDQHAVAASESSTTHPSAAAHVTLSDLAIAACASSSDFIRIAGQGPLCEADNSYVLQLSSGRRVTVSPPDAASTLANGSAAVPHSSAALTSQQCVGSGSPRVELVYAHFSDQADNFSAHAADIQQMFRDVDADYIDYDASHYFGKSMHLSVECDSSGNPVVHDVALSTPLNGSDFSSIAGDMQNQGYDQSYTHYWVWTDGNPMAAYGYAGQSTIQEDDSAGPNNSINTAYEYSVNYGFTDSNYGPQVFAHENGHAMGAVQLSAPDSTGAFHCTDGVDVMCYNDGGPRGSNYTSSDCGAAPNGTEVFDCRHQDYFNANPAAGSYLATHWNVASTNNHWIYFTPLTTSTAIGDSSARGVYSQPLTLEAAVSSAAPAAPPSSGTVTFYDGSSSIGSASVNNAGQAFLVVSSLGVGAHTLSASFGGGNAALPSQSVTINYTVTQASSATTLSSSANPVGSNVPFTLSATVRPLAPATGTPSGTVTFHQGSAQIGTASLNGGVASLTTSLSPGSYSLWASYAGSGDFQGSDDSSSQLAETVMDAASVQVQSSANNSRAPVGTALTFTATVNAAGGTPGGTPSPTGHITFEDGRNPISGALPLGSGTVTFTTPSLEPGAHTINAVYSGDGTYAPSTSSLNETVTGWNGFYELDAYGGLHAVSSSPLSSGASWPGWNIARGFALDNSGHGGVVLDGFGGLHPFGDVSSARGTGYWKNWDVTVAIAGSGNQGYVLDAFGGLHPYSTNGASLPPAPAVTTGYWNGWRIAQSLALFPDGSGGVVLDGFGGVHPFTVKGVSGKPASVSSGPWWNGWDIARSVVLLPGSTYTRYGGYILDGFGGIHPFGTAGDVPGPVSGGPYWGGWDIARGIVLLPGMTSVGYVLDGWGGVEPFGGAPRVSSTGYTPGRDLAKGAVVS